MTQLIKRWKFPIFATLLLALYTLPLLLLEGHAAIFVKIDGIDGNVTAAGYEDWHQIDAVDFGVSRSVSAPDSQNRTVGKAQASNVSLVRDSDSGSPLWLFEALTGTAGKNVQIAYTVESQTKHANLMTIDLEGVLISGMQSSSNGENPQEYITLDYTTIRMKTYDPNGKSPGTAVQDKGYDFSANKQL